MSDEMGDDEFLRYCDSMADTPRCGFAPCHVARLVRLAGYDERAAAQWEARPTDVYDMDPDDIRKAVNAALAKVRAPAAESVR